jgi:hypothetical protein
MALPSQDDAFAQYRGRPPTVTYEKAELVLIEADLGEGIATAHWGKE